MIKTNLVVTTPQDLQLIVSQAVVEALSQIALPQKVDPLPQYMTIEQAAAFLNLAVPTLYGLTSKRKIPFIKRAKKLYFQKQDLANWLNEGTKKTKLQISHDIEKSY